MSVSVPRVSCERPSRGTLAMGCATAAIGALALAGWVWDVESFKTIYGPVTMKTNAAIGLLLCGAALIALSCSRPLAACLAAAAGIIGGLTLSEHIVGWDLGIDQFLFEEPAGAAATASPNRMGPNASTAFVLAGLSINLLALGTPRAVVIAQRLSIVALVLAAIPMAGYLYGAEQLYGIARYTGIALHTAVAFLLLNFGILMARTDVGLMSVFFDDGPAGLLLRRLSVPIIGIPLVLGYVTLYARQSELVDRGFGIALYAIAVVVVLAVTVWMTAQAIEVSEQARRAAERERDRLIVTEREARVELERANRLKDRFMATLSHELRTPLNVILGWTQMLERGVGAADSARIVAQVARNGRLLVRLVGDLLDYSRIASGHMDIARVPTVLDTLVQNSIDGLQPSAGARGIGILADLRSGAEPIDADPERLQQIVWNLLSNAVKFTPHGGQVVVRTSAAADAVTLVVSDTGTGFDEAFAKELFTPFRQADSSSSREHGGLGLGLSIARHIAVLHGGTLEGSSPGPGRGATFTLTLPLASHAAWTPLEEGDAARLGGLSVRAGDGSAA